MILFVDNEHPSMFERRDSDRRLAWRARITYRLEDVVGDTCLLQRTAAVSPDLLDRHDVRAVFISGHGAPPERFDEQERAGLRAVVAAAAVPVFGFCGGMQFIGETMGVGLERLGAIGDDEDDPLPAWDPGWRKEFGYAPVRVERAHPLLDGLGADPVVRHAHAWQLDGLPEGFVNLARTEACELQLIADDQRKLVGTQFHPEYWTDEHPAGRRMLENFCRWAGLTSS